MKIGILGAGGIAVQMAKTVAGMKDVENYAVAARSFERAQAFAEKYGFSKAYGSYEEMLADPQVDLVYIATPHSHHYLHAKEYFLFQGFHIFLSGRSFPAARKILLYEVFHFLFEGLLLPM